MAVSLLNLSSQLSFPIKTLIGLLSGTLDIFDYGNSAMDLYFTELPSKDLTSVREAISIAAERCNLFLSVYTYVDIWFPCLHTVLGLQKEGK